MFKSKSKKYLTPLIILIAIFFSTIIYNFYISHNKKYTSFYKDDIIYFENFEIYLSDIYKIDNDLYIELVNKNWLETENKINFKAYKTDKIEMNNLISYQFKGITQLKIPIKKGFKNLLLILEFGGVNSKNIYFNESEIISRNSVKIEKDLKLDYVNSFIKLNEKNIKKIENEIKELEKENQENEKDLSKFEEENQYNVTEDLAKIESKLNDFALKIKSVKNKILHKKNEIISLKNKNIMLENEKKYILTGEKIDIKDIKLLNKIDENGKEIVDNETLKKIEEENKKAEEKEKENQSKKEEKEENNTVENNQNKTQKNTTNNQKNTTNNVPKQPKKEEKPQIKKVETVPKNDTKKIIKPIKNDKEKGEIEIEFKP